MQTALQPTYLDLGKRVNRISETCRWHFDKSISMQVGSEWRMFYHSRVPRRMPRNIKAKTALPFQVLETPMKQSVYPLFILPPIKNLVLPIKTM